jgi:hypothetical protein
MLEHAHSVNNQNVTSIAVAYRNPRTAASGMFIQGGDRQQLAYCVEKLLNCEVASAV